MGTQVHKQQQIITGIKEELKLLKAHSYNLIEIIFFLQINLYRLHMKYLFKLYKITIT